MSSALLPVSLDSMLLVWMSVIATILKAPGAEKVVRNRAITVLLIVVLNITYITWLKIMYRSYHVGIAPYHPFAMSWCFFELNVHYDRS